MQSFWDLVAQGRTFRPPRRFLAIDFDSRRLRIVCADRSGRTARFRRLAQAELPEDVDAGDAQAMGQFLARTLRELGIRTRSVVMCVPRGKAMLKPLKLPPGTADSELPGMVQFQVEKELPFRLDEAVVDFTIAEHFDAETPQESDESSLDVLAGAVPVPVVDHYRQIALAAGVKLLRLGLRANANTQCVAACLGAERPASLAVVHVTTDETEIDVLTRRSLTFSRAAVVPVPRQEEMDPAAAEATARLVAAEAARTLQTYQAVERGQRIERVLIAGGTGVEPLVAQGLSRRLGVACERLSPSEPLGLADDGETSGFITALGLAVGGAGSQLPLDFLNPKRPVERVDWPRRRRRLIAAGVGLVVLLVAAVGTIQVRSRTARVEQLRGQLAELRKTNKKVEPLVKKLKAIEAWESSDPGLLDHLAFLSAVFPPSTDVYVESITSTSDGKLSLAVRAKEGEVIAELAARLRAAGYPFRTRRIAAQGDRLGYVYSTSAEVGAEGVDRPDLTSLPMPSRPDDDVGQYGAGGRRR